MTKTIVIGEAKGTKNVTPIKFERCIDLVGREAEILPNTYKYIEFDSEGH